MQNADLTIVLKDGRIDGIEGREYLLEHNEIYREFYLSPAAGRENKRIKQNGCAVFLAACSPKLYTISNRCLLF